MRGIACVVVLVACGDSAGTEGPPDIVGGARLHARWQTAGDARRFVGWHDITLDQDCTFLDYVAGRDHRCLPRAIRANDFFSDPACSQPLAFDAYAGAAGVTGPPEIVLDPAPDACTGEPTISAVGAAYTGPVFTQVNDTCTTAIGNSLYQIGEPLDAARFASAVETPDGNQLWLVADDGARTPWAGWDGHAGVQPSTVMGGGLRWAPWQVAYAGSGLFADASCATPAATKIGHDARCPLDAVLEFPSGDLGDGVIFHASRGAVDTVYKLDPSCTGQRIAPDIAVAVGDVISLADLPPAGEVVLGDENIRVHYATLDGQAILSTTTDGQLGGNLPPEPDAFIDAFTTEPCDAAFAADGAVRCMPQVDNAELLFLDAACTQLIVDGDPGNVFAYTDADSLVHVRVVRGAVPTPSQVYFHPDPVTCSPTSPAPPYHDVGDELAAEQFAMIEYTTDD